MPFSLIQLNSPHFSLPSLLRQPVRQQSRLARLMFPRGFYPTALLQGHVAANSCFSTHSPAAQPWAESLFEDHLFSWYCFPVRADSSILGHLHRWLHTHTHHGLCGGGTWCNFHDNLVFTSLMGACISQLDSFYTSHRLNKLQPQSYYHILLYSYISLWPSSGHFPKPRT